jgi:hypothetical protein
MIGCAGQGESFEQHDFIREERLESERENAPRDRVSIAEGVEV